jgi:hypothetical protein
MLQNTRWHSVDEHLIFVEWWQPGKGGFTFCSLHFGSTLWVFRLLISTLEALMYPEVKIGLTSVLHGSTTDIMVTVYIVSPCIHYVSSRYINQCPQCVPITIYITYFTCTLGAYQIVRYCSVSWAAIALLELVMNPGLGLASTTATVPPADIAVPYNLVSAQSTCKICYTYSYRHIYNDLHIPELLDDSKPSKSGCKKPNLGKAV